MKKRFIALSILMVTVLGGCSLIDEASSTVTYVKDATDYVNEVNTFVNEVPDLVNQAINDEQALTELETQLEEMKKEINQFNELEAPEIAADLHQQIMEQNLKAEEGIDLLLNNIEDGQLDPAVLENTELSQSLEDITNIVEQIKQLGQ
jgi:TolA-binding protein